MNRPSSKLIVTIMVSHISIIIPPDGYKITNNTKIKYLEFYPEFITYVDEFISESDDTDHFKQPGAYLVTWFRENGYDNGITSSYQSSIRVYFSLVLILIFNFFFCLSFV